MLKFLQRRRHTTDKGLHPKYYKHWLYALAHARKEFVFALAYFDPKKVHFEAKIGNFLTLQKYFQAKSAQQQQKCKIRLSFL